MTQTRYHYTTSLNIGGDIPDWEGEVEVSYSVAWGRPEQGPAYDHGGLPADPDEVVDLQIDKIDGEIPCSTDFYSRESVSALKDMIWSDCYDDLLEHALEVEAGMAFEAAR